MKIACLGWGSLIWDPKGLEIQGKWFDDGPLLPIEFTRQSDNGRITLIIDSDERTELVRVLWALMTVESLDIALLSLKEREGTTEKKIHYVTKDDDTVDKIKVIVKNWLVTRDLDAVIWTGLSYSKWTDHKRPDLDYILKHLKGLDDKARLDAENYIRKAPKQIDTLFRRRIEEEFGWVE